MTHYTNAPAVIREDFRDTEDLDGLFSGWDAEGRRYDIESWQYEGTEAHAAQQQREAGADTGQRYGSGGGHLTTSEAPVQDPTLQHPRCVYQILRRHYARYTPELVEEVCGVSPAQFHAFCEALCDNSGPERTSSFCYAVGWTQHSVGVQYIRTAAIIQLLLGNVGRPGGGVMALRGHASIQGSTDIPTLYNILPGYLPMARTGGHETLAEWIDENKTPGGYFGHVGAYMTSLLKAYFGAAATPENDFCFGHLPRISGDHNIYQLVLDMLDGRVPGMIVVGENPAVGSAHSKLHRRAMAKLDWLVVRDLFEIETASFWKDAPEIETGELRTEEIATEVFFMPAAAHTEKDGSFTNTQRLLQWHHQAVEPEADCRSELWFYYHLGRIIRERLAGSEEERDRPVLDLAWTYPLHGAHSEPSAEAVLAEIGGLGPEGEPLPGYTDLKDDGSTSCGCWIYAGVYKDGVNQAARRPARTAEMDAVAADWAWAWPANRRILYNRASARPDGTPWSERKRYIWWDAEQGRWTGRDVPDFPPDLAPDYVPPPDAEAERALRGDNPFVMQSDGIGWLFVPEGIVDGPLPTHYEPHESPVRNLLYGQQANPVRQQYRRPENPYNPTAGDPGAEAYPFAITTYRLTEHHTAGAMSRMVPHLAELQPEMFCEVSPALAELRGLEHGGWATIVTSRAAIEARVLVTDRLRPFEIAGQTVHQIGLPYHWGQRGMSTGDSANDLFSIVLDPDVRIQEVKAATADIRPGRRPRGPALPAFVEARRTPGVRVGPTEGAGR